MYNVVQKVAFAEAAKASLAPTSFEVAASDEDEQPAEAAGANATEQKTKKLTDLFDLLDTDNNQTKTNNNATPVLGTTAYIMLLLT